MGLWVGDDGGHLLDLLFAELTGSDAGADSGLLAEQDGESSANSSDASDGERSLSFTVEVGVQDSENVLEVVDVFEIQ